MRNFSNKKLGRIPEAPSEINPVNSEFHIAGRNLEEGSFESIPTVNRIKYEAHRVSEIRDGWVAKYSNGPQNATFILNISSGTHSVQIIFVVWFQQIKAGFLSALAIILQEDSVILRKHSSWVASPQERTTKLQPAAQVSG